MRRLAVISLVVRRVIAGQPALQFAVGIRFSLRVYLLHVLAIDREFDQELRGIEDVKRLAVAVIKNIGIGRFVSRRRKAVANAILSLLIDFHGEVTKSG